MKKDKNSKAELVVEAEPPKRAEENAQRTGEYTIEMALAEAREKYRNTTRPLDRWTIARAAQTILRENRAEMQLPKRFEGENEYQAWLKSKGLVEVNDHYRSQTGRTPKFPSRD